MLCTARQPVKTSILPRILTLDRELYLQDCAAGFYCRRNAGLQVHDRDDTINHEINAFLKTRFILDLGHSDTFSGWRPVRYNRAAS